MKLFTTTFPGIALFYIIPFPENKEVRAAVVDTCYGILHARPAPIVRNVNIAGMVALVVFARKLKMIILIKSRHW